MALSWPQVIAIMLLMSELGTGARLGSRAPEGYTGWVRVIDACTWSALLYWGGFWSVS